MLVEDNYINFFNPDSIITIYNSNDPFMFLTNYLENKIRINYNFVVEDTNFVSVLAEFYLNNLINLWEILNINTNNLIINENDNSIKNEDNANLNKYNENKINLITDIMNATTKLILLENKSSNNEFNDDRELEESTIDYNSVDYNSIKKDKLAIFKQSIHNITKKHDHEFKLNNNQIKFILEYLKNTFFDYTKLYYLFTNIKRENSLEIINFIINKPLKVESLDKALYSKDYIQEEKDKIDEIEKKKLEEQEIEKQKREEASNINTLNSESKNKEDIKADKNKHTKKSGKNIAGSNLKQQEQDEFKKNKEIEDLKRNEEYENLLNELFLNIDVKKLIKDNIEEMHRNLNNRVKSRQDLMDNKLKDIEEMIKGKKK